jgi:methylglutaconyl-CoA hydratase
LAEDASLRFVLLRGRGRHFSAGADLAWMQQSAQLDFNTNLDDAHELGELMYALHRLKAPTLAVVQGAAFGGALGLISCCDMAIGAEDAQLCLSEVRIGLAPAVISPFVVKAIGERAARRYALTAERFSGVRARELGLLAEVPGRELDAQVEAWMTTCCRTAPSPARHQGPAARSGRRRTEPGPAPLLRKHHRPHPRQRRRPGGPARLPGKTPPRLANR